MLKTAGWKTLSVAAQRQSADLTRRRLSLLVFYANLPRSLAGKNGIEKHRGFL
jgi:hypothetical protein